ncbi:hypothetical protein HK105_204771 [Polyrhizophydium stewartii]|uniref:Ankyrin repeat protein n=1 Tax=Polyrhizophydium stewartii TaxID=2732419 RepID=A0ABR4N7Z6_9FUNG
MAAAARPWRFAGCRDVLDMLDRLPAELDAAIMEHAGVLTKFRFNRLPRPLSPETFFLLWCEALISDDVAAVRLLPFSQSHYPVFSFLAHSREMVEALNQLGAGALAPEDCMLSPKFDLVDKIRRLADDCLKGVRRALHLIKEGNVAPADDADPRTPTLINLICNNGELLRRREDGLTDTERIQILNSINNLFISLLCQAGATKSILRMIGNSSGRAYPIRGAVLANNAKLVNLLVDRSPVNNIQDDDIATALRLNYNSLALRMIELVPRGNPSNFARIVALCVREGNAEVLRAIATPDALQSPCVRQAVPHAAAAGRLEIVEIVCEAMVNSTGITASDMLWQQEALEMAIMGGWVDVARRLIDTFCLLVFSNVLVRSAATLSAAMFKVLRRAHVILEAGDIMDSAAQHGNLALLRHMRSCGFNCTTAALDRAAQQRLTDLVEFLCSVCGSGCSRVGLAHALKNGDDRIVQLLLDGPITGSSKEAGDIISAYLTAKTVRALHHGMDCSTCDCGLLWKAIRGLNVELIDVFLELEHAASDSEADMLGQCGNIECVQKTAPLLNARQWNIMHLTATRSRHRHVVDWIKANKPARAAAEWDRFKMGCKQM